MKKILQKIAMSPFNKFTWIGKDYSVQHLIDDLTAPEKDGAELLFTTA